ncbi:restriction endonuclease subunit S [uncultured Adlercreutzia sp.]|uniref:restriction endonuclease subunit S n=1 Tax=uncultured Adlercreutzia sp. TaxID=875803 RepID=UPI0025CFC78A|nr:restriction endonuclease subunit S [uncultured Adlercreutzia sp.]
MSRPLHQLCELIVDCPHSTAFDEGEGYPLIRTPNIGPGYFDLEGVHRVGRAAYDKRNLRAVPRPNDLILAREAPAGNVAIIPEGAEYCLGQRTVLIRPDANKVCPQFLNYYLNAPEQRHKLLKNANGATVSHVNMPIIRNLPVNLPSMDEQVRIADTLSAYDALIDNNRRQIKLLEEAAQRLYKEWFIDLHFPGYESTPIDPETGLPEGWGEKEIQEVCLRIQSGSTPSRKNHNYWDNATEEWFKTAELQDLWLLDSEEKISADAITETSVKEFPPNSILMAIYASPTLGRLGILTKKSTFNQAALGFVVDENFVSKEWLFLKLYELRDEFNSIARGAGQQNISGQIVKDYDIVLPSKVLINAFTSLVAPIFHEMFHLQKLNSKLSEARNRLLPKLMSSEIEVL